MIVIGVDAHRDTHTVAAVNRQTAELIDGRTIPARKLGHKAVLKWARGISEQRIWAIEDARNMSGGLERFLLGEGEEVLRVPPKLMANERKAARQFGKSDPIDALAIARAAIREPRLPHAVIAGPERDVKLIADWRDDLVDECVRHQRRLRWLLHELDPELPPVARGITNPANLDRLGRQLARMPQNTHVVVCRELVVRIRELSRRCQALQRQLAGMVKEQRPALLELPGCGPLMAARIIAEIANFDRFDTEAQLASYAGVAPLDASSGRQQRHRLNRTGNRKLNRALHIIAVTQIRIYAPARDYIARRMAQGKTRREALRALKRHLARRLFQILTLTPPAANLARRTLPGTAPHGCWT